MKYNKLGSTDIDVTPLAMGCWAIVGDETWGPQDEKDAIRTIHAAMDAGINFFDTAEVYGMGYSEEILGKALENKRDNIVIASKVRTVNVGYNDLIQACENSLKRLKTDYIDLYQIHWPSREVPFEESYKALTQLKKEGKIRAIGMSNFGANDLENILSCGPIETDQLPYNLLWRAIEYEIVPKCQEKNVGILCYSPLAQGLLTGKFKNAESVPDGRARTRYFSSKREMVRHGEDGCEEELFQAIDKVTEIAKELQKPMGQIAISWLFKQPMVTSVLAGARTPEQIQANVKAMELELSDDIVDALNAVSNIIKQKIGKNPDMWEKESRIQ